MKEIIILLLKRTLLNIDKHFVRKSRKKVHNIYRERCYNYKLNIQRVGERGFTSKQRTKIIYGRGKHRNRRNRSRIIGK